MAWRGSADVKDRFFGAVIYLIPLYYVQYNFGSFLLDGFVVLRPFLNILETILAPLAIIYSIPFASLIVFFILYLAVVRNEQVSYFIRFNTLQAILIDIALFLLILLGRLLGIGFIFQVFASIVYLATLAACFYAIAQSALGRYAEIPTISEAAYTQLR